MTLALVVIADSVFNGEKLHLILNLSQAVSPENNIRPRQGTQRAKVAKKVHKPHLGVNVINFELN